MYIAIDIGGTNTRTALFDNLNSPHIASHIKFPTYPTFEDNYERITSFINGTKAEIKGIGIGIAGDVNKKTKLMSNPHNIFQFVNIPFVNMLKEKYKCDIAIDNDAVVAATGEAFFANPFKIDFIYMTWGTGINIVSVNFNNGKPIAMELEREKYFSGWEEKFSGGYVFKKFSKRGDLLNDEEWEKIVTPFHDDLEKFVNKSQCKLVIFGGGISVKKWDIIEKTIEPLKEKYDIHFKLTELGENVGLYGALSLLKQNE